MKISSTIARRLTLLGALTLVGATVAQVAPGFHPRPKLRPPLTRLQPGGPGDALPGLTPAQRAQFDAGREEFEATETIEGGLGPIFNGTGCSACHTAGATGGASAVTVTRFGRDVGGVFDPLERLGGPLLQDKAIDPQALERVPPEANVVARRLTTPLFGAGLIEAIPDDEIVRNAQRRRPDGVQGRVAFVTDVASGQQRVGRFGWKAQQATLLAFAGDAYLNEMGVTNRLFPTENAPNGNAELLRKWDRVLELEDAVDPASGISDIDRAADFMRLLAPAAPLRPTASSLAGGRVFDRIGCTACHEPSLNTGEHAVAALAHKAVPLYSDLLLHDMGSLGDGIAQGAAGTREMRTPPLWGLRLRAPYLHDGRAPTVDAAIRAHAGQGTAARQRYVALPDTERRQVLDFLGTL